MRIGIKILNFVLATILLTSAALHQEKADVFEFDLVLGVNGPDRQNGQSGVHALKWKPRFHNSPVIYGNMEWRRKKVKN